MKTKMGYRSLLEANIDEVLAGATSYAMQKAAKSCMAVHRGDPAVVPTSIRLNPRTLAFYDNLANELGTSRNAVIHMLLEHLVNTAISSVEHDGC